MNFESQLTLTTSSNLIKIGNQIVADRMNDLLSDYNIFNQNVKGFHWNFMGPDFFDLHQKFEDLSGKLSQDIDKLAGLIAMTGFLPLHSYSAYLKYSNHKEITGLNSDEENVENVVNGLQKLIVSIRWTSTEADDANDIISGKLLTQLALELENELWIFTMFAKY